MSKVTRKGQVTIPKDMRETLGANPGDMIDFVLEDGSVKLIKLEEKEDPLTEAVGLFEDVELWIGRRSEEIMKELRGR